MALVAHICGDYNGGSPSTVQCNLRKVMLADACAGLGGEWGGSCSSAREVELDLFLGVCLDMICLPQHQTSGFV